MMSNYFCLRRKILMLWESFQINTFLLSQTFRLGLILFTQPTRVI